MRLHNPHPWHKVNRVDGHPASGSNDTESNTSVDGFTYADEAEALDRSPATVNEETFKARFGFGSAEGWSGAGRGLAHMWRILQTLPESHVNHDMLTSFKYVEQSNRNIKPATYSEDETEIVVAYDDIMTLDDLPQNKARSDTKPGDGLHGVNKLDSAVKHEIGHSVDALHKYSDNFNPAGWQDHSEADIASLLVAEYGQGDASEKANLETLLTILSKGFMLNREDELAELIDAALDETATGSPYDGEDRRKLAEALDKLGLGDSDDREDALEALIRKQQKLFDAYYDAAQEASHATYDGSHDSLRIGDRFYQLCADGEWRSYDAADRQNKVSSYQYASPKEWFAEHYAAYYYSPETRAWLKQHDRYTYDFFRRIVDKNRDPPANLAEGRPTGDYDATAVFGPE